MIAKLQTRIASLAPGVVLAATLALVATFLSAQYGAPAMLMALLLGMALNAFGDEGRFAEGVDFAAKGLLRAGVALLGVRISAGLFVDLGVETIALIAAAIVATIAFGVGCARLFGRDWRFGVLTGAAVAICGASAAITIAAVLPRGPHAERDLTFTVLSVTVLSTIAMILYPLAVAALGLDARAAGVFLGGSIHDVAQVVGAGFSVSAETGETATLVKLIRVTLLAPVALVVALAIRRLGFAQPEGAKRPPLAPSFVLVFLALAALNSANAIPAPAAEALSAASGWALLIAVAAVGVKTSLRSVLALGGPAVALVVAESAFIALVVLVGVSAL